MLVEWLAHDILYRLILIQGEISNLEPLRIGAGKVQDPAALSDLKVMTIFRNGRHEPYIPGSSLKGVFRSTAEKIARTYGLRVCNISPRTICGSIYKKDLEKAIKNNDRAGLLKIVNDFCIVCKLFGSAGYKSHIDFGDGFVIGPYIISSKTGIAINRRTGAVARRALYTVEYVEPGAKFSLTISATNIPNYAIGLLAYIIDYINMGLVKIGGFKTRGFGTVKIDIKEISISGSHGIINSKLVALDEYDTEVHVEGGNKLTDPERIKKFLEDVKKAWDQFVKRAKG